MTKKVKVIVDTYHWNEVHERDKILTIGKDVPERRAMRDIERGLLAEVKTGQRKKNVPDGG